MTRSEVAVASVPRRESSRGLVTSDFRCIARNGFGDPENSYAHSMAWFRENLFVSTTRNAMTAPKPFYQDIRHGVEIYPVPVPDTNPWDNDFRAQIWRYSPWQDSWTLVHRAAMTEVQRGWKVPRQIGFRAMTAFQGKAERAPALYAASWSTRFGPGPMILRTTDGERFEEITEPGIGTGLSQGVRSLVPFNGKLFAASAGRGGSRDTSHDDMTVLSTDDPTSGVWQLAADPFFGDRRNASVYDMCAFAGSLYAGTLNPYDGFQLWKTKAEGRPPYRWTKVLDRGAYRGKLNETIISMAEFDGCLYIGTAILNCGHDRIFHVGPAAPELLRVYPDDTWELVVGEPRRTPHGVKAPISGMGPGFDSPLTGYMWRMCVHDGWLYVSTAEKTVYLRFADTSRLPDDVRRFLTPDAVEVLVDRRGGFDLWRTKDGIRWSPITRNGFGNPFNLGGRTMESSPYGLFVGTANLFGPDVAVRRAAGWRFERNPQGGAEVWLGYPTSEEMADGPATAWTKPPSSRDSFDLDEEDIDRLDRIESLLGEYFEGSDYRHIGCWRSGMHSPRLAGDNLIDELVAFTAPPAPLRVPVPATDKEDEEYFLRYGEGGGRRQDSPERKKSRVLELYCGRGASTRRLVHHFSAPELTAVTDDSHDLETCCRNAPGVEFLAMRLPKLKLESDSYDIVLCAEAMGKGARRSKLLQESLRVLKPGGCFVGSDVLVRPVSSARSPHASDSLNAEGLRELIESLGFVEVTVVDATEFCWVAARRHGFAFLESKLTALEIDPALLDDARECFPGLGPEIADYVLVSARKPADGERRWS